MSKQLWNRQETKVFLINCILRELMDDDSLDLTKKTQQLYSMDIEDVVAEYEYYVGEFMFELPSK